MSRFAPMPTARSAQPSSAAYPWAHIVAADWSKQIANRAVWHADVASARVSPASVEPTVRGLIAYADELPGRVLVGIDAALGIPADYLRALRARSPGWEQVESFPQWLARVARTEAMTVTATEAAQWRHERPFFAVPKEGGKGSLGRFSRRPVPSCAERSTWRAEGSRRSS